MTADEFVAAFAAATGTPAPSDAATGTLLEIAAVAAHASERIAAPLCCYLAGVSGRPLAAVLEAARELADEAA